MMSCFNLTRLYLSGKIPIQEVALVEHSLVWPQLEDFRVGNVQGTDETPVNADFDIYHQ